eukprot:TRINITY_DN36469_c0_g1_i1.p1 TRINITY_DN36469_c0_g1~~TRINITY_DN36469_c0_g1_i1.p1  ORF type:complete len:1844 (-),score=533.29 TRINITY_DN36469_c0_g1_i1:697-6228(-)
MGRRRGGKGGGGEDWWYPGDKEDGYGGKGQNGGPEEWQKVQLDDADAAFILGRGGKTKQKIVRVSGAQLELHERGNIVDVGGNAEAVRRARKYIDLVRAQRLGPVHVDNRHDDGDLTMMDVPMNCVGFVTGANGNFLRMCEDEFGTLMFFCDYHGPGGNASGGKGMEIERLAIFGSRGARAGAELKVMSAIELKHPGHFTKGLSDTQSSDSWGTDTLPLGNDDLSFALGQGGSTRKKLAKASGCILEYVGNMAYMVGTAGERRRCRDYITWLTQQRLGPVFVDIENRIDATALPVQSELTGLLKGSTLRDIEQETETFCFLEGDPQTSNRLLIFGSNKGRKQAEKKVKDLIKVRPWQPPDDHNDKYKAAESSTKSEVRVPPVLVGQIEASALAAIQGSSGAKVKKDKSGESVALEGYEHQVHLARKQLNEYMYNMKVEDDLLVPKDIPFHVLIAKGPEGKASVLEEVRNKTRVRVKVVQEEKKIIFAGAYSQTSNAKRDLQAFLGSFITHNLLLERAQLEQVSQTCKTKFPKMQHFRHMSAANINKESCALTLTGTPDAVQEAHALVDSVFLAQGWQTPTFEVISLRHGNARSGGKGGADGKSGDPTRKASEAIQLDDMDSAFILGRGGKTKHKISRASGAQLELHENSNTVEITGNDDERRKARKYLELIRAQRLGPVNVTSAHDDGDLAIIQVPQNCVGFVTGSQGSFLRTCEEEWGTLMFFCNYHGPGGGEAPQEDERLAIFGNRAGRLGAELKVKAAIETKIPGYFTRGLTDQTSNDDWGQDTMPLEPEELSFALGKDGSTRKKLARASGCILEYIGNCAFLAGALPARRRVRDYLGWLLKQRTGTVYVDLEDRKDASSVDIPDDLENVASVFKSTTLRAIEQDTRTFCFLEGNPNKAERLLIFGCEKSCRDKAKAIAQDRIQQKMKTQEPRDKYEGGRSKGRKGKRRGENYDDDYNKGYWDDWDDSYYSRGGNQRYDDDYYWEGYKNSKNKSGGYGYDYNSGYGNGGYGNSGYGGYGGGMGGGADGPETSDTFLVRGDVSVHVMNQTGPNGEDPVIESVETTTETKLTLVREKRLVKIEGPASKVAQAKRQLQLFMDKFVSCKIQLQPQIAAALANKVSHYIRPMPWMSSAEVDEQRDQLKIQGHQESVDQTFKALRELYRDHSLVLRDSDVLTKHKGGDHVTSRHDSKGNIVDIIRVSELDAAFILGRGGKTKTKIARVSGATLELHERSNTVEIYGGDAERRRAAKYVELVRAQRAGPVTVDEAHDDGDLTMIAVPSGCVGFVTGSQGNFLRSCEEEWGTLMFFCDYHGPHREGGSRGGAERLAIFGDLTGRCGAELKVMAAIETKVPGYYTANLGDTRSEEEWGTDTIPLHTEQFSYALGKKGSTRKKLARASGAILEYVGNIAFLAGDRAARQRCREYLNWLCDQAACKTGRIDISPTRTDVTLVPVPSDCVGYVMGDRRATLSKLEEDWGTLIFFVDSKSLPNEYRDVDGLAIFGSSERGRAGTELKVMGAVETKRPQFFTKGVGDFHCPQAWGVDTLPLVSEELSFALGKEGGTRKKLARASGCILEYVGNVAYMAGSIEERLRSREYLSWLMRQRNGAFNLDITKRSDVSKVDVPEEMIGLTKANTLRDVEKETGTFCFFQGDRNTSRTLLICGHRVEDRTSAVHILQDMLLKGTVRPAAAAGSASKKRSEKRHRSRGESAGAGGRGARGPRGGPSHAPPHAPPPRRVREWAPSSDSEDDDESESGSEASESSSEYSERSGPSEGRGRQGGAGAGGRRGHGGFASSSSDEDTRRGGQGRGRGNANANANYGNARRRQDSPGGSDEEIVPYW